MWVSSDNTVNVPSYIETIQYALRRAKWAKARAWMPRKCIFSDKWMWLKPMYKGTRIITGPGTPVIEVYWASEEQFIWWKLNGNF